MRLGLRGGRRVHRSAVPAARLRRRLGRAAALGQAHARPGAGCAEESVLCRGLRARPLHVAPPGRSRRHRAHRTRRAAPHRMAGADPRSPRRLHRLGRLPGQRGQAGGQPHQRRRPATARGVRAVSGHHRLRILRQADAHQLPHRPAARLRMLRAAPTGSPPRPAGRSPRPRWTTR